MKTIEKIKKYKEDRLPKYCVYPTTGFLSSQGGVISWELTPFKSTISTLSRDAKK